MPVMKVVGLLEEGERDLVRCWVEKSTIVEEKLGEDLMKHQIEGQIEESELEKKQEKPNLSSFWDRGLELEVLGSERKIMLAW